MSLRSRRAVALALTSLAVGVFSVVLVPVDVPIRPDVLLLVAFALVAGAAVVWPWNGRA